MSKITRTGLVRIALLVALTLGAVLWPQPSFASGHLGAVYALTNDPAGNAVLVWDRAPDGTLTAAGSYATGGLGSGAGLGSQGAVILAEGGRWLFAVNAGSNEISSFRVRRNGLELVDRVASGGTLPTSLTYHDDLLYVLNAGGTGNITGFRVDDGELKPIRRSTRPLSGDATAPAQVEFSPDGETLVVTERATNQLSVYEVDDDRPVGPMVYPSSGATPFGFAFARRGVLVVSEANGAPGGSAASSYRLSHDGELNLVSGSVATLQGAACWTVVTRNGRFAYTANAASASVSGFSIGRDGSIALLNADGRTGVAGAGAADMALSRNSEYLYVRNGRDSSISAFIIGRDGSLQPIAGATGLPAGTAGLAAR